MPARARRRSIDAAWRQSRIGPGKVFKFADDTYPRALDYKDFLPLSQLKTAAGVPVALKPGMAIEYWLEAEDNCDYPKPNVGKSKVYRVTLAPPQPPRTSKPATNRPPARRPNTTRSRIRT